MSASALDAADRVRADLAAAEARIRAAFGTPAAPRTPKTPSAAPGACENLREVQDTGEAVFVALRPTGEAGIGIPAWRRRPRFTDFAVSPAVPVARAVAIRAFECCETELTEPEGAHGLDCPTTIRNRRRGYAA